MPLTGREVGPTRICQIGHITGPTPEQLSSSQNTHNLEETTLIALTGLMKQLCDIATYADEIFGGIFDIAKKTGERTEKLHKQVISLNKRLSFGDDDTEDGNDDECINTRNVHGPEAIKKEQALHTRYSRPKAIKNRYESSDKAPDLHQFASLCGESDTQAHLMYSDPSLFVNAWLQLMDKEAEKYKKARKRSFKKNSSRLIKIAAVKKKVHDPKSKTFIMVDVAPQYATLPAARGVNSSPQNIPLSSTLNRKKYGITEDSVTSPTLTDRSSTYSSPVRQSSFDNNYRSCSTPIASPGSRSPSGTPVPPSVVVTPDDEDPPPPPPEYDELPLPNLDMMPLPDDLPPPPSSPLPPVDITPPPFSPPPVPDAVIKPAPVSFKQRVLRTCDIQDSRSRDTLLDLIRSSSFSLKPVSEKRPAKPAEPTYATYQGTDVASILQRRKYLMGVGMDDSDYSDSGAGSDGGDWD